MHVLTQIWRNTLLFSLFTDDETEGEWFHRSLVEELELSFSIHSLMKENSSKSLKMKR